MSNEEFHNAVLAMKVVRRQAMAPDSDQAQAIGLKNQTASVTRKKKSVRLQVDQLQPEVRVGRSLMPLDQRSRPSPSSTNEQAINGSSGCCVRQNSANASSISRNTSSLKLTPLRYPPLVPGRPQ